MDFPAGDNRVVAGRYRLRGVLGAGAMGTVWSAYDEFLQRPVAVKEVQLPPGLPTHEVEQMRDRTLREARAIARLSHPNVITLYDVVQEGDEPFVVMELLDARSLAELVTEHGPLGAAQAAAVGDAIAAALEAAHAAGITHRDVKPGNVLVARDGRVKLTDFGIARNTSDVTMTSTGLMLGSPAYMAPEVAAGKNVSPAADLWGLGATLFAVTEGHPPYDADGDPLATADAVVHDDVPTPSPGPLAAVISGLMTKDAAARPAPGEVRARLVDLHSHLGPVFAAEWFGSGPDDTSARHAVAAVDRVSVAGAPRATDTTAPLAADPGPLPFPVKDEEPAAAGLRAHAPLRTAGAVITAVALFAVMGAAGFALTRFAGGAELVPPSAGEADWASASLSPLLPRTGDATFLRGDRGGRYTVRVPREWTTFVTQQPHDTLPQSTVMQYVSPDGRHVLSIERFPDFFVEHDIGGYLAELEATWPPDEFVFVSRTDQQGASTITYRTVETTEPPGNGGTGSAPPAGKTLGRTTFAHLRPDGPHLWIISVTVPSEQESRGRTDLFDRIVPTFAVTG